MDSATPSSAPEPVGSAPASRTWMGGLVVALALMTIAAACGDDGSAAGGGSGDGAGPVVVATTSIWADVTRNVACQGAVEVVEIVPVGADAHSFEPSLSDREVLGDAALIVANGLSLEAGLLDTIEAVRDEGTPVFEVAAEMGEMEAGEPAPNGTEGGHDADADHAGADHAEGDDAEGENAEGERAEHDDEGHDHAADPHVWFDPVRVAAVLPALGEALVSEAGLDAAGVEGCVTAYQDELADLDAELAAILATVPPAQRKLVTNHESLGFFADRYDFEVVGAVIPVPSTLAEANPADLEALARLVQEQGVPAIFAETQHSTSEATALAERIGDVAVVELYTETLGEPGSGADTYLGFLRTDAERIAAALSGTGAVPGAPDPE